MAAAEALLNAVSKHILLMSCPNRFKSIKKNHNFYATLWRYFAGEFFDLKNSINRQINGNLEPLKGFGINFFGSYPPLIYCGGGINLFWIYIYISLGIANYGDILQANFFDLKNSINRQINGNLEPLKGFGINFFGSYPPLIYCGGGINLFWIYIYISLGIAKQNTLNPF